MVATAGDIAAAQQAYVAPGQPDQPWLERSAMLLQQFGQDAAAIRPLLKSHDAAAALDEMEKDFKAIVVLDGTARQDLQEAQNLLAADLIFSEGHDTIAALVMTLRGLESGEKQMVAVQRASLERQQFGTLACIGVFWILGILVLARAPASGIGDPGSVNLAHLAPSDPGSRIPDPGVAAVPPPATVDLAEAAAVCGALAHATDTSSLRDALASSAAVLGARGIIVWMGAGEELFPALSFGYDERIVQRLGPIARAAGNATAEAWRTAQLRTVPAGVTSHGAIAAPIDGVAGCVGVFAAEVRNGREEDAATRAVAAILAAQLAGIVSAWPAASSADVHKTA